MPISSRALRGGAMQCLVCLAAVSPRDPQRVMASSRIFLATAGLFADEELLSSRGSPSPGPTPVLGSELNVRGLQPDRFTVPYKPVISDPAATWKAEREREAQASLPPLFAKGAPPAARLTDPSVPSLLPTPRLSARGDAPASENAGYHAHNHRDAPYAPSLAGASWRHGSTSNSPPGGASNSVPASAPGRAQALESWRHGAAPGSAAGRELVGESWRHGSAGGSVQSSRPASPARSYCGR
ncbi:hypothetical protein T484DRAFT_1766256 [Baffinella frigidus]|nr:hypothetical protein T484DRAFT_1766256 [Cryptophyta sp. CCMP2293]